MGVGPDPDEFEAMWRSLESPQRRAIARLANSGETSQDYQIAGLVAGLAERRLRPIEPFGITAGVALGYLAFADTFLGGYDSLVLVALISGLVIFFSVRRRNLEEALAGSREVLAAGPPVLPEDEGEADDAIEP